MDSWMIEALALLGTVIGGYFWLKYTALAHEKDISEIKSQHIEDMKKTELRLDVGVKRFEELSHQISQLVDRESADRTYARREILDMHMKSMEKDIREVKESNVELGKKLDHLIGVLSTNIVRTLTPHGQVFGGQQ